jgi:tetratricopeptide (TPR) repeat protein
MKKRAISLAGLFFCLIPSVLLSQVRGQAKMLGSVLDEETGQPIEGVTVKAYFPGTETYIDPSPTTDKDGKWKALFIRTGVWNLSFEKAGYYPQKLSYRVGFEMGAKTPEIEVRLKKMKGIDVQAEVRDEIERGNALLAEKKNEEALAVFQSILEKNPEFYIIKTNIGSCHFAMENYEKALENFLQVQEKQPDRSDLLIAISNAYNAWGKQDQAMEWYAKIPLSDIRDIDSAYNAGAAFSTSGNQAEALKYFQRAVEIDPQFADGYYQLGLCHVALGSNAEAIEALQKSIELAPDSANAATAKAIIEVLSKK